MSKKEFSVPVRKNVKIVFLDISKCVPMPELEREFYDDSNYQKLKRSVASEGLKACYPIRVVWNEKKRVYEVFVGIHRLRAAKEIGRFTSIPAIVETELDKQQAFAEGIIDNHTHAALNPIDFAREMKLWGEEQAKKESRVMPSGRGRPKTVGLARIAEKFLISEDRASNYFQVLKLPEDVVRLVGRGRLWITDALILTRLLGTPHENKISHLANEIVSKGYTKRTVEKIVESIMHGGSYGDCDNIPCSVCGRFFPRESVNNLNVCMNCSGKIREGIRSGRLEKDAIEEHNEAEREFLRVNAFAEKHYGKQVPACLNEFLDKLYNKWLGEQLKGDTA